ncbi:MAG: cupredoxin domain-containing protein [Bdellovibrionia bacterium]
MKKTPTPSSLLNLIRKNSPLAAAFGWIVLSLFSSASVFAEVREIQATAVEINGTKFWIPSSIVVKKGDTVKLHLTSKVPGANNVHGFAIEAYKIQALATEKTTDVEFNATQSGIFPIRCHLHPAHIGGQLVVLD